MSDETKDLSIFSRSLNLQENKPEKMTGYPRYDFRYLLGSDTSSDRFAIAHALGKEPIQEVCRAWDYVNRDARYYPLWCQGIRSAVSRGRYPLKLLCYLVPRTEFHRFVLEGLFELWVALDTHLRGNELLLGKRLEHSHVEKHKKVNLSLSAKLKLLEKKETLQGYRITYLKDAEEIIHWIQVFSS